VHATIGPQLVVEIATRAPKWCMFVMRWCRIAIV